MAPDDEPADIALQHSEERFRLLIDAVRDYAICMLDLAGKIVSWNSGAERITGWTEAEILGAPLAILLSPAADAAAQAEQLLGAARSSGRIEKDGKQRRKDGSIISVTTIVTTLAASGGRQRGFAVVMRDVTESRRVEDRQRVLVSEIDHRAKNALAVVQSILRLSVAPDTPSFMRVVEGRIAALARIHTRIATHGWVAAPLSPIFDDEFAIMDQTIRSRFQVAGPAVWFAPTAAQSMALAVHELATNACRHGALRATKGAVDIQWRHDETDHALVLTWTERNGPRLRDGIREGFGYTIIRAMIETQLDGAVTLDASSGNLGCRLSVPARHLVTL